MAASGQGGAGPLRFGVYELDARAGELRKNGLKVRLQEQPLQILTMLLERPGDIVSREEICKRLWPNGTFVDFDHSLNAAVMRLREALDDSADNPRFVETVPRRGYRFLAPVEGQNGSGATEALQPALPARRLQGARIAGLLAGPLLLAAVAAGLVWWKLAAREPQVRRFEITVPDLGAGNRLEDGDFAIAPDGKQIAYLADDRLWLRAMDSLEAREVPGSEGAQIPFWSPDGAYVGFAARGKLWKSPGSSGETATICDLGGELIGGNGASWGAAGTIVFSRGNTGLLQVSARGGDPRPYLDLDLLTEEDLHQPAILPGGNGTLYVVHRRNGIPDTLMLFSSGKKRVLLQVEGHAIWSPVYSSTGHILFRRRGTNRGIWALPFSLSKLEVTGEAFLVAPDAMNPSVADDGTLLFEQAARGGLTQLVWINRSGAIISTVGPPQLRQNFPAISPDGRRIAVTAEEKDNSFDIWIHEVTRGTAARLPFDHPIVDGPVWSARGDHIAFTRFPGGWNPGDMGIMVGAADGASEPMVAAQGFTPSFSLDGKWLAFAAWSKDTHWDLWYQPLTGDKKPMLFLRAKADQVTPQISPDGRYLAYQSDETGRQEVYVKRFPSGEGKWRVSSNGGHWPRWNRKGDKLYYAERNNIMEVEVNPRPSFRLGTPKKLFTHEPSRSYPLPSDWPDPFDVTADGQKFVLVQPAANTKNKAKERAITVVQNWFAEFKGKEK